MVRLLSGMLHIRCLNFITHCIVCEQLVRKAFDFRLILYYSQYFYFGWLRRSVKNTGYRKIAGKDHIRGPFQINTNPDSSDPGVIQVFLIVEGMNDGGLGKQGSDPK
jgi:hypothetical protein